MSNSNGLEMTEQFSDVITNEGQVKVVTEYEMRQAESGADSAEEKKRRRNNGTDTCADGCCYCFCEWLDYLMCFRCWTHGEHVHSEPAPNDSECCECCQDDGECCKDDGECCDCGDCDCDCGDCDCGSCDCNCDC